MVQQPLHVLLKIPIVVLNQVPKMILSAKSLYTTTKLPEHSLECSTASGYENKLECTLASEGYWLNQGIATECQSTCSDGQYITTPCDGTRESDDLGCTACQSTCSDGEYITTPCDGTTTSDDLIYPSNRCVPHVMMDTQAKMFAVIADASDSDEQCAATCPDGYIVNSDSTACTPIICEENQYVLSFECEPCADGSYNAAGDDASQGNTTCDTIMCSSNVDPLRYPDYDCGEYGLLRSDFQQQSLDRLMNNVVYHL